MTTDVIEEPTEQGEGPGRDGRPRRAAYTVQEAAALLGLSLGSTYTLIRAGEIPARRMGGRWIVPKQRFHRWLNERSGQ